QHRGVSIPLVALEHLVCPQEGFAVSSGREEQPPGFDERVRVGTIEIDRAPIGAIRLLGVALGCVCVTELRVRLGPRRLLLYRVPVFDDRRREAAGAIVLVAAAGGGARRLLPVGAPGGE